MLLYGIFKSRAKNNSFCNFDISIVIIILFKLFTDNPLLKKKGVPECILFVTTRITKYPLLIESLIKAAQKDRPSELEVLKQANNFVKVN